MKQIPVFSGLLFLCYALSAGSACAGYNIHGTVKGLPDDSWIYLKIQRPGQALDSCLIKDGRFNFKGVIPEQAVQALLVTKNNSNYVFFWLENSDVTIEVTAGAFKQGAITGSPTEDESRTFKSFCRPFIAEIDSLSELMAMDSVRRKTLLTKIIIRKQEQQKREIQWIREHPNSLVAVHHLHIMAMNWGKEAAGELYELLSPSIKNTRYGQEILDYLTLYKGVKTGDRYVDFEQLNAEGRLVRLSQIEGRYILLDFWASWCGPCLEENPRLKKAYELYKDKGFAILGVSLDDNRAAWTRAIAKDGLTWENVSDLKGDHNRAALMYGIHSIPSNFLINEQGIVIARNLRGEKLETMLHQLFSPE